MSKGRAAVAFAGAIVALALAFGTWTAVRMAGFPDGHLTAYDRAVDVPLRVLAWVQAGLGVLFLTLVFAPLRDRSRTIGLTIGLIVLALAAVTTHLVLPWYFGTHLGLDNGAGG